MTYVKLDFLHIYIYIYIYIYIHIYLVSARILVSEWRVRGRPIFDWVSDVNVSLRVSGMTVADASPFEKNRNEWRAMANE